MMKNVFHKITVAFVLLALMITAQAFCQTTEAARKQLEEMKIPWDEGEFLRRTRAGEGSVVKLFLSAGMRPDVSDSGGRTALMFASEVGYTTIVNTLLDSGAFIDGVDTDGRTALIHAAIAGRVETTKILLDRGADVEAKDNEGLTALMWAESSRNTQVAALIKKTAGMEIYSVPGQTLATTQLQSDVWNYLLQLELASDSKCRDHSLAGTRVIRYPTVAGAGTWLEQWTVNRCGGQIYYLIDFRHDEAGGTAFKVGEEKEPVRTEEIRPASPTYPAAPMKP